MMNEYDVSADGLYKKVLKRVMRDGRVTKPRGFICLELSPFSLTLLNPYSNIVGNPLRKINRGFMAAEFLWMWSGRNDVEYISKFNSKIAQFSDDGKTFFGAYGPKIDPQLSYVYKNLKEDPWSRQAVINIWRESPPKTKDVPCTIMMHFIRRPENSLNLIVYMRSQDCWLGLPYDLHNFACIQICMANYLSIRVGSLTIHQGSFHAYEQDFGKIMQLVDSKVTNDEEFTPHNAQELFDQKYKWCSDYLKRKQNEPNPGK